MPVDLTVLSETAKREIRELYRTGTVKNIKLLASMFWVRPQLILDALRKT